MTMDNTHRHVATPGEVFGKRAQQEPSRELSRDEAVLARSTDTDALAEYTRRAAEIRTLAGTLRTKELLQRPEFEKLGWQIGHVKFYNPEKGFGFAIVDGEDVFFGKTGRMQVRVGLHSEPEVVGSWSKAYGYKGDVVTASEVQRGDTILIDSITAPYVDDRSPRRGRKPRVNPRAGGWVRASEYTEAIKGIYSREPQIPGIYCDEKGLYLIDNPWSQPHKVMYSAREGNWCNGASNNRDVMGDPGAVGDIFDDLPFVPQPQRKEVTMLELASRHGIRGGEEHLRRLAEMKLDEISGEVLEWDEVKERLSDVEYITEDGVDTLRIGSIVLKIVDAKIPVEIDSYEWRYGMDDEEDVAQIPYVRMVGGLCYQDFYGESMVWENLSQLGANIVKRDKAGQPTMTADEIRDFFRMVCDINTSSLRKKMETVGLRIDGILSAHDDGEIDCRPMTTHRRRMFKRDWKADLRDTRRVWSEQDRLLSEEQAAKARQDDEARKNTETAERESRENKAGLLDRLGSVAVRLSALIAADSGRTYPALNIDDPTYFDFDRSQILYTDHNVTNAERLIEHWESELANRISQERVRLMYGPQFRQYADRAKNIGFEILFEDQQVVVGNTHYPYSDEGVTNFVSWLATQESNREKHVTLQAERDELSGDPALINFGGQVRETGATRNVNYWVVRPDGTLREDTLGVGRRGASTVAKTWGTVGRNEVALGWEKDDVTAPHRFTVHHCPPSGATPEQIQRVCQLEQGIAKRWSVYDDRRHDPRGDRSSPPVGRGWGLDPQPVEKTTRQPDDKERQTEADASEVSLASLEALQARFNS